MNHGYKVEIIRGFLFEKEHIFSEYVDSLYGIKEKSKKDAPEYLISKMLLNSLYGRFGMNPEMELHEVVCENRSLEIELNEDYIVTDITPLEGDPRHEFHTFPKQKSMKTMKIMSTYQYQLP
jgi:hypothetical protein